jgi:hypothetical protein
MDGGWLVDLLEDLELQPLPGSDLCMVVVSAQEGVHPWMTWQCHLWVYGGCRLWVDVAHARSR